MEKILVTGANGQLGNSIKELISKSNFDHYHFDFVDLNEINLADESAIRTYFSKHHFTAVLNCAAYTAVDLAETETEICYKINADAVGIIAQECKKQNALLIHISTDYVFSGNGISPYLPENETDPQNIYGKSKLLGEKLAFENNPKTIVIRTAWVYSPYGKNFVKTMKFLFENKEEISVVADQKGIPTLAIDLAEAMLTILESKKEIYGVYHYTNANQTDWFEFATEIKNALAEKIAPETLKIQKINAISTAEYPTPAQRPMYSVLDLAKIQNDFNVKVYDWKESLHKMFKNSDI